MRTDQIHVEREKAASVNGGPVFHCFSRPRDALPVAGSWPGRTAVDPVLFLKDKIFEKKGSETWSEKHSSPCWR
jgi:hypothetical protein